MSRHHSALVASAALAAAGVALSSATAGSGNAVQGGRPHMLFENIGCAECHGHVGQGGASGPRLAGKSYTIEAFRKQLRHPSEEMPPYTAKVLSDEDLVLLHQYVLTTKK